MRSGVATLKWSSTPEVDVVVTAAEAGESYGLNYFRSYDRRQKEALR
jgi:hypothetical protein